MENRKLYGALIAAVLAVAVALFLRGMTAQKAQTADGGAGSGSQEELNEDDYEVIVTPDGETLTIDSEDASDENTSGGAADSSKSGTSDGSKQNSSTTGQTKQPESGGTAADTPQSGDTPPSAGEQTTPEQPDADVSSDDDVVELPLVPAS